VKADAVTILVGDVLDRLADLPDDSVDCCVTSPPYWGLRDYGVAGQIGLERTLGEHLDVMVRVFREVRRVLKPTGTLWLNYGDCYATAPNGRSAADTKAAGTDDRTFRDKPFSTVGPIYCPDYEKTDRTGDSNYGHTAGAHGGRVMAGGTLKPKDLCMIPNRLAIALQDDGWWVRSEIVWGKSNPMPDSSGAYRPSTAHEKIFMLAKSVDGDVWRARDTGELSFAPDLSQRCPLVTKPDTLAHRWVRIGSYYDSEAVRQGRSTPADGKMPDGWDTGAGSHGTVHRNGREKGARIDKQRGHSRRHAGFNDRWDAMTRAEQTGNGRLLRNYEPADLTVWEMATMAFSDAHFATFPPELARRCIMAGCRPGGHVLDPFGGAGTTGLVAAALGRTATLIELNPDYAELARGRIADALGGALAAQARRGRADTPPGPLFQTIPGSAA
jgi:DNA modification methylase